MGSGKTSFLCRVGRPITIRLRVCSLLGLFLWLCVMYAQIAHEWSHHRAHHGSNNGNHSHCDHHHHQPHEEVSSPEGVAFAPLDECALCDWDWFPAGSIGAKKWRLPSQQWCQASNEGAAYAGHVRIHSNQTKSHRGPPWNG